MNIMLMYWVVKMTTYNDRVNINTQYEQYGKAIRISRAVIIGIIVVVCVVTPFTNWFIPFISKVIQTDLIWRF